MEEEKRKWTRGKRAFWLAAAVVQGGSSQRRREGGPRAFLETDHDRLGQEQELLIFSLPLLPPLPYSYYLQLASVYFPVLVITGSCSVLFIDTLRACELDRFVPISLRMLC